MSTPSPSPSPPPPLSPPTNPTPLSSKKTQPLPWTHQETTHLIQSYQEKWYSLKRGQLKASQWEEVAVTVAARCGYDYNHPSKSAVQCRHKMEKLRRRYRDEKRVVALGGTCYWQYFDLMDSLERGPLPISAQPLARVCGVVVLRGFRGRQRRRGRERRLRRRRGGGGRRRGGNGVGGANKGFFGEDGEVGEEEVGGDERNREVENGDGE
ncbi:hypothetical protein OIU77_024301 [Salix suchowensis]|uniref:Myb-like domain-containing protein n=1 Tax=Salix suchowensis TaxID=1278906 RepID=A0ABQ9BS97_9ROSI|nr:hypothetical protein OIU77_024301 [Salix suchowensis]